VPVTAQAAVAAPRNATIGAVALVATLVADLMLADPGATLVADLTLADRAGTFAAAHRVETPAAAVPAAASTAVATGATVVPRHLRANLKATAPWPKPGPPH
jgi:hypothetical protein